MEQLNYSPDAVKDIPPEPRRNPASGSRANLALAEAEAAYLDNKLREQALIEAQNNNELRKELPDRLWCLTISWLIAVLFFTFFGGIDHDAFPGFFFFKFDSAVLVALITSTTASVLGLFAILLNYIYPSNSRQSAKNPTGKNEEKH